MQLKERAQAAWDFLTRRKAIHCMVYRRDNPAAMEALADLAVFCHAFKTCEVTGDRDHTLVLEGRRQVFLYLTNHLNLSVEELFALYGGFQSKP